MSLHDATELEDLTPLANESDPALLKLQKKTLDCIAVWDRLGRPFDTVEIAWYNRLTRIADFLTSHLQTRYGCND